MTTMLKFCWLVVCSVVSVRSTNPPHIVLIVADDLGWNDVSWNNIDIKTPNLQDLANNGVILNSSYVMPVCSPTRGALLTGYYPYHLGLQHGIIQGNTPSFLTTKKSTLSEKLQDNGYTTHMVGKWHLGMCNWTYTPTYRGFDSFGGILGGAAGHYDHMSGNGYDFYINREVNHTYDGNHSTEAYTDLAINAIKGQDPNTPMFLYLPYQAPHTPLETDSQYENEYSNVVNDARRIYSGMVTQMDNSVGRIRAVLEERGFMDNLVLVFISDNGGDVNNGGNNYPLRGAKTTYWEGGVRTPAFVYSKTHLDVTGYTQSGMLHAVDWYPTLLEVAGVTQNDNIDGVSQWGMIKSQNVSARTEFVYNIDEVEGTSAIRVGRYKLTEGNPGSRNDIFDVPLTNRRRRATKRGRTRTTVKYRLYDIDADPSENKDLSRRMSDVVDQLKAKLDVFKSSFTPAFLPAADPNGKPRHWGGVWSPGWCAGDR
ncbi:arylsulfatase I-like [Haliotis rubra]|uniref:arylsulfatase I-like n=1 Tax=Haliotis rubra TaxID=36100 RepID=UPI001EE5A1FD|nr:arylsulfatase I-like [Haliotis rubra]